MSDASDLLAGKLTDEQLAKALGKSVRTIWRWRASGVGPKCDYVGRTPITDPEVARRWTAAGGTRAAKRGRPPKSRTRPKPNASTEAPAP